jgi:hypothetical protein
VTGRRWHRPALACAAIVVPGIVFAQVVLFHGASQGMVVEPLGGLGRYGLGATTGLGSTKFGLVPTTGTALAAVTGITVLAWAMMWGGAAGLLAGRRWREPAHLLLLGLGAAALATVLLLNHYGFSQTWFLVAARPYLGLLAAAGLAALVAGVGQGWWLVAAVAAGAGAAWLIHLRGPDVAPTVDEVGRRAVLVAITTPNLALLGAAAAIGAAALALARRRRRATALAVTVAVLAGFGLAPTVASLGGHVRQAATAGFAAEPDRKARWPYDARAAARWLRDHSSPDDLVATNGHCRRVNPCDNLHFWFSAFAERRFLVEGWGYTPSVNRLQKETGLGGNVIPYWDPASLAANDAAFHRPSPATVDRLRREHGVRWLFVDETDPAVRPGALDRVATLRHRAGAVAIYEL